MTRRPLTLTVNDVTHTLDVQPHWTLLHVLRDALELTGTKNGCSQGVCGACTVLVDGETARACLLLAMRARGRRVTTVEGLAADALGRRLQDAFVEAGAVQCGFCTPGILLSARALLAERAAPGEAEVREALAGNLCRCTGYARIVRAVVAAGGNGA
jgi:carbon-monoxide dehydrogenase small subunit